MTAVVICSPVPLEDGLRSTCLWRDATVRHLTAQASEARALVLAERPRLLVVDRDLPGAVSLVSGLRQDAKARHLSMAVVVRGEFASVEVDLLEAGANVILRFPVTAEWDARLTRLLQVPARRDGRFLVRFSVHAYAGLPEGSGQATAVNLSVNGMLLECPFPLGVGDALSLEWKLEPSGPGISGAGQVVRVANAGRFGIEFRRLEGGAAQEIRRFVESLRA